jgi:hypothetical protein
MLTPDMRLIELTNGRVAIVDACDYEWLMEEEWRCHADGYNNYAQRVGTGTVQMHVEIAKQRDIWVPGKGTDHKNTCGLDNRFENLRAATAGENTINSRGWRAKESGLPRGVHRAGRRLCAAISPIKGQQLTRYFEDTDEGLKQAIACRVAWEIEYYIEFRYDEFNLCPGFLSFCPDCHLRFLKLLGPQPIIDWDALTR